MFITSNTEWTILFKKCCNKGLEYYPNDSYGMYQNLGLLYDAHGNIGCFSNKFQFEIKEDVLKIPQAKSSPFRKHVNAIYSQATDKMQA